MIFFELALQRMVRGASLRPPTTSTRQGYLAANARRRTSISPPPHPGTTFCRTLAASSHRSGRSPSAPWNCSVRARFCDSDGPVRPSLLNRKIWSGNKYTVARRRLLGPRRHPAIAIRATSPSCLTLGSSSTKESAIPRRRRGEHEVAHSPIPLFEQFNAPPRGTPVPYCRASHIPRMASSHRPSMPSCRSSVIRNTGATRSGWSASTCSAQTATGLAHSSSTSSSDWAAVFAATWTASRKPQVVLHIH